MIPNVETFDETSGDCSSIDDITCSSHDFRRSFSNLSIQSNTNTTDFLDQGSGSLELMSVQGEGTFGPKRKGRFMLKKLQKNWYTTKRDAAVCLSAEVELMKGLTHSNIARLRGTVGQPGSGSFGIVLDQPDELLSQKISQWSEKYQRYRGKFGFINRRFDKLNTLFTERLIVAYGIAKGTRYLHSRKIIHLGICPSAIACDRRGNAKIFDFSKARRLANCPYTSGLRPMSPSTRYTAPEVLCGESPTAAADVYSFGMVFWHIMAFKQPFERHNDNDAKLVQKIQKGCRIANRLTRGLPNDLKFIIGSTLSVDPSVRPRSNDISQVLCASVAARKGMKQGLAVCDQYAYAMDNGFSFCSDRFVSSKK